jgi:hypothetical protein
VAQKVGPFKISFIQNFFNGPKKGNSGANSDSNYDSVSDSETLKSVSAICGEKLKYLSPKESAPGAAFTTLHFLRNLQVGLIS